MAKKRPTTKQKATSKPASVAKTPAQRATPSVEEAVHEIVTTRERVLKELAKH
jgi:hypothetical protein